VLFSLYLMFFATAATSFTSLALISRVTSNDNFINHVSSSGVSTLSTVADKFNTAASAFSLATNLSATSLIFLQLWTHRRFFDHAGLHRNLLTTSQWMLLFLVEAGFIFCIGQVLDLFVGIYFNTKNNIMANFALQPMYLPVIILLEENNRTITETFSFDSNILADVVRVESASHPEEGLESPTTSDRSGRGQLSTHEDSANH